MTAQEDEFVGAHLIDISDQTIVYSSNSHNYSQNDTYSTFNEATRASVLIKSHIYKRMFNVTERIRTV